MATIQGREVIIPDENGKFDPLGHDVCLKIIPKCQDPIGPKEPYERGEVVCIVLCEKGWCEDQQEPVPVTKHEVGMLLAELGELFAEMSFERMTVGDARRS